MKVLLALALMMALLAIRNTAAACPLGVCMGDSLNPNKGWDAHGLGIEVRKYKGNLPFDAIGVQGTRKGGACGVWAIGSFSSRESALQQFYGVLEPLVSK